MMAGMREALANTYSRVRGFFAQDDDDIREIQRQRFPEIFGFPYNNEYGSYYDQYAESAENYYDLHARYRDYEQMDDYPEITAALDQYADEATQKDFTRKVNIWAESDNQNIAADLNYMLHVQIDVPEFIWPQSRYLAKYGNEYSRLYINENGVIAMEPLPVPWTRRVHDEYGLLMGFVTMRQGAFYISPTQFRSLISKRPDNHFRRTFMGYSQSHQMMAFEGWEVQHFRLLSKDRLLRYGTGIVDGARWPYKRLVQMEDAAVIHKLTRSAFRYVFYVDTGTMPPAQGLAHAQRVRDMYRRRRVTNPSTGKLDLAYSPLSIEEDFFVPVHSNRGEHVRIDSLSGSDYQPMEDVDYFRKKLGKAIKIPGFGRDDDALNQPLSNEDFKFAKSVERLQNALISGYENVSKIHLLATNRDPDDYYFKIRMTQASAILEMSRIEVMSAKADIMDRLQENVSIRWLMVNLFGFSEDDPPPLMVNLFGFSEDEAVNLMVLRQEELDMLSAAETEREIQRDRLTRMAEEDVRRMTSRERHRARLERAQLKMGAKAMHGALGVSMDTFAKGKTLNVDQFLHEVNERDPELATRLHMLGDRLHQANEQGGFRVTPY